MQTSKILAASLIDIIFDGRGKEYGAYELRKNYSKRINRALLITLLIAALICSSVILASSSKRNRNVLLVGPDIKLENVEAKKPERLPEPEKQKKVEQVKAKAYTEPVIMPNDLVEDPLPTQTQLVLAEIDVADRDGVDPDGISRPADLDKGTGIVEGSPIQRVDDTPLTFVEIDAKFSGNWVAFLERNLNANVPLDNGASPGRYSVVIQFVVDTNGVVSDIRPLTNHGYGTEAEAVRVLKKATKWEPAIQNGHKVKAYRKQVIVFEINEEG